MSEKESRRKSKSIRTDIDPPPTMHEDLIPLEDLKIEEKEMKKKDKSKNSSSTKKRESK